MLLNMIRLLLFYITPHTLITKLQPTHIYMNLVILVEEKFSHSLFTTCVRDLPTSMRHRTKLITSKVLFCLVGH